MPGLAPEGYPYIAVFGVATAVTAVFAGAIAAAVPLAATLFMMYFFRDPERAVPGEKDVFVAPADGRVIVVRDTAEEKYLKRETRQISIFMSPANVHVNRSPCDGRVKSVLHNRGRYGAAYRDDASIRNENIEMVLGTDYGDILVRQVAGFLARRAVCRKGEGDVLRRGERFGIIKFSSRVDIYLPKEVDIRVKLDERVKAGETVLASLAGQRPDGDVRR